MKRLTIFLIGFIPLLGLGNNDSLIAVQLNERAYAFFEENNLDSSLHYFSKLGDHSKETRLHSEFVDACNAQVYLLKHIGREQEAFQVSKGLLNYANTNIQSDDPRFLGIYSDLAVLSYLQSLPDQRDEYVKQATKWVKLHDNKGQSFNEYLMLLSNIGAMILDDGDYHQSIYYQQQVLDLLKDSIDTRPQFVLRASRAQFNVATAQISLENFDESVNSLEKSKKLLIDKKVEDHEWLNTIDRRLAYAYYKQGKIALSLNLCSRLIQKFEKYQNQQKRNFEIAFTYHVLGQCYTALGNYDKAEEILHKAIDLRKAYYQRYQKLPRHPEIGKTQFRLAEMYRKKGDHRSSQVFAQRALIQHSINFSDTTLSANPSLADLKTGAIYLADILRHKAELLRSKASNTGNNEDLLSAFHTYQLLLEVIERDWKSFAVEQSKLFLLKQMSPGFEGAIGTAVDLFEQTKDSQWAARAFQFAEKSKAVLLFASLKDTEARYVAGVPDSLLRKEKLLLKEIENNETKIFSLKQREKANDSTLNLLRRKVFEYKTAHSDLITQLETEFPVYYGLKYSKDLFSLPTFQSYLEEKEQVLIEYYFGEDDLYIFYVGPSKLQAIRSPLSEVFTNSVSEVLSELHRSNTSPLDNFSETLHELYTQLIPQQFALDHGKHLIIVPDGSLNYLPFEVLSKDPSKADYLLYTHPISYAYSAKLLFQDPIQRKRKRNQTWLGYAPQYEGNAYLAFNADEVRLIENLYKGKSRLGEAASATDFLEHAAGHSILHLAMHGYLNDDKPMYSYLAFQADPSQGMDGRLYAHTIFNMELDADLVVLSACKTGLGPIAQGEGVLSLARSFRYAGCPSILMNLWDADGAIAKDLMYLFYKELKDGRSKDKALRQAKITYLETAPPHRQHPRYWANFVLVGDSEPIPNKMDLEWLLSLSFITLIILGITFLLRKKRLLSLKNSFSA